MQFDVRERLRRLFPDPVVLAAATGTTEPTEAEPEPELSALYWGDGDWTCSFECGESYGNEVGWFGENDDAVTYWESDHSPTFSVWTEDDVHGEPGDSDYLAPGTTCLNCGKVLRGG